MAPAVVGGPAAPPPTAAAYHEKSGLEVDATSKSSEPQRNMSEVEANKELKFLQKLHRWDREPPLQPLPPPSAPR
jgi:hypothetical protein